jgi:hypothetical protein
VRSAQEDHLGEQHPTRISAHSASSAVRSSLLPKTLCDSPWRYTGLASAARTLASPVQVASMREFLFQFACCINRTIVLLYSHGENVSTTAACPGPVISHQGISYPAHRHPVQPGHHPANIRRLPAPTRPLHLSNKYPALSTAVFSLLSTVN